MTRRQDDPDLALAARLRNLAATLETFPHLDGYRDCGCLRCRARTYSERGYPSVTIGDGGSRSSDRTSSTERAGIERVHADLAKFGRYPLALDALDRALMDAQGLVAVVLKHGATDDWIPAGQGPCILSKPPYSACDHTCNPRKNQNDVLRVGLCPACHQAWLRYQRRISNADRQAFLAWRTKELTGDSRTKAKGQHVA